MAAKSAKKPRPNKNSDGQNKQPQPTMSHDISISPGKPATPPPPPGAPQPGATNPMTHPNHPQMQSTMGTAPPGPSGAPTDQRQVQERIQFKDMQPPAQNQVLQQQGIDPYAPIKQVQQGVDGALQQGGSSGPIPNMLSGPYVPPGVESFPDDMAHLTTLMGQGFAPGASPQEHEYGLNAHSLAKAKIAAAMQRAQDPSASPMVQPPAAPPMAPQQASLAPGIPQMGSSMGSQPPMQPGAPGGIPPEVIAALAAQHKPKTRKG